MSIKIYLIHLQRQLIVIRFYKYRSLGITDLFYILEPHIMKKGTFLLAAFFALTAISCDNEKDYFQGPETPEKKDFSLTEKINVTANLPENTRCLLFTSNPYIDGEMVGTPTMVAYAPFNLNVTVPKSVDKLYMYVNGTVTEHKRADIKLESTATRAAFTRADEDTEEAPLSKTNVTLDDAFVTAINTFYPEALINVWGDDLKVSTDLVATKKPKEVIKHLDGTIEEISWGNTKIWLTYVTNGGCNFSGSLWYYTYEVDENLVPTTPLESLELVQVFNNAEPTSNDPLNTKGTRVYLGEFEPGTRIGFLYKGNAVYNKVAYPKYSTPHYNKLAYDGRSENGSKDHTYNGKSFNRKYSDYSDNEYTCGVIRAWEYGNTTYATLGMENRLPSEATWDGDFNDMILLVEATPLTIENVIEPPVPDPTTIKWSGYWLFEDNYPIEGDYDFNDLVVKYAITEISNRPTIIDLQFVARGADMSNSFGINGNIYFENLSGYENVYADKDVVETSIKQITMPKATSYIPMMKNGNGKTFDLNSYWDNEEDFPCILEIPIIQTEGVYSKFDWCLEKIRIDEAYPRYKEWVKGNCKSNTDWYSDTPVAGTVWNKQ